jgi:hypothetical protein
VAEWYNRRADQSEASQTWRVISSKRVEDESSALVMFCCDDCIVLVKGSCMRQGGRCRHTTRDDDDDEQEDDADDQAHSHLHVLPPHLLSDSVGATSEALRRNGQVVGLVLQTVKALAALRDLVDVVAHDIDGRVNFLHDWSVAERTCGVEIQERRTAWRAAVRWLPSLLAPPVWPEGM